MANEVKGLTNKINSLADKVAGTTQVKANTEFTPSTVAKIGGGFLALAITSLLIGLAYGLGISYLLIKARSMTKSPVVECALIFSFAYLSYVTAEIYH